MGERQKRAEDMAGTSSAVTTIAPQSQKEESSERVAVITLRPTATGSRKKVVWTEDTVDNEGMNKKKSKCCCIYEKPRKFGESDSEDSEDECEHCYGHVERRTHRHHHEQPPEVQPPGAADAQDSAVEPTVSIQLSSEPAPAPAPAPPDKADPAGSAS